MVPYINVRCYIKARLILPMFPRNFAGQSKCFILSTKKYGFSNPGRIRVLGSNGDVITTLQLPEDHEFSTHRDLSLTNGWAIGGEKILYSKLGETGSRCRRALPVFG